MEAELVSVVEETKSLTLQLKRQLSDLHERGWNLAVPFSTPAPAAPAARHPGLSPQRFAVVG